LDSRQNDCNCFSNAKEHHYEQNEKGQCHNALTLSVYAYICVNKTSCKLGPLCARCMILVLFESFDCCEHLLFWAFLSYLFTKWRQNLILHLHYTLMAAILENGCYGRQEPNPGWVNIQICSQYISLLVCQICCFYDNLHSRFYIISLSAPLN